MRGCSVVIAAAVLAEPAAAQGLEGQFRGLFNDLRLEVAEGQAVAEVTSGACIGYLEGTVEQTGATTWEIAGSVPEAPCILSVTEVEPGRFEMIEGAGCTYYHGTSCELSGVMERAE